MRTRFAYNKMLHIGHSKDFTGRWINVVQLLTEISPMDSSVIFGDSNKYVTTFTSLEVPSKLKVMLIEQF